MHLMWTLLAGLVAGWLAGTLVRGGGFGLFGDLVLGVVGAAVGGFICRHLGITLQGGRIADIAVATAGAIVLLILVRLIKPA